MGKGEEKFKFCPFGMVKRKTSQKNRRQGSDSEKVKENYKIIHRTPFTGLSDTAYNFLAPLHGTESCRVLTCVRAKRGEKILEERN